ncbi:16S rRNA (cytosine(967)-C(5))-methyltransferase RsmB [Lederbergia graminis]|uniref:16S rRNA (cytosine(967)-C(5))-methyltransferase n=1 Tax=Lederbergia graminis TaxID=735518 RepID=A0ABW0LFS5_9BACI
MSKKNKNVRESALEILEAIDKQQAYSNLLLNQVINKNQIKGPDVGLLTEIVYGTLQRKLTLDYFLQPFIKKKLEVWVMNLLRLSLYQMHYLDKIPDRAVLFEAVEIAKKRGHKGIASLVNGVLRAIQRQGVPSLEEIKDPLKRLSIEMSHPLWLVQRWEKQYGLALTKEMCAENLIAPVQTARVNTTKITRDEVLSMLRNEGFEVEPSVILPVSIRILRGNVANSTAFEKGYLSIQDESSMIVAYTLDLEENMTILDACAAPGGKTGHIAELLNGTGKVQAIDIHSHKVKLIQSNAARLGLSNIEASVLDSRKVSEKFSHEVFDRILVDAPCSGLGVLRKKPDIKYVKKPEDIDNLKNIQQNILNEAAKTLKKGGILVYSTCTVDKEENYGTINDFLQNHPEFKEYPLQLPDSLTYLLEEGSNALQIFPQDFGGDGFFIASFKKSM